MRWAVTCQAAGRCISGARVLCRARAPFRALLRLRHDITLCQHNLGARLSVMTTARH